MVCLLTFSSLFLFISYVFLYRSFSLAISCIFFFSLFLPFHPPPPPPPFATHSRAWWVGGLVWVLNSLNAAPRSRTALPFVIPTLCL